MDKGRQQSEIENGPKVIPSSARWNPPSTKRFLQSRDCGIISFLLAVLLCLGLLAFSAVTARAASFTASLDRDTIVLGEQAALSLKFEGGSPQSPPSLPEISGLSIGYVGRQSLDLNINGVPGSIVTFTYALTPQKTGEFVIPALTADANGQQLATQPLKLTVQKAGVTSAPAVNSGNEVAFMKLLLPQTNVYVGQVLTAQLQIYLRDDVQNHSDPRFTSMPADGFFVGKGVYEPPRRVQIGNHVYTVIPASIALTVLKAGDLELGPFAAQMIVVLPSEQQGGDPIFRFFNSGEQRQVSLATDSIEVQSLPLPTESRPAGFNGAVGHYTMTVTAGPTNVAVGDPITVHIQISGRGVLDSLTLPNQPEWHDFKVYPPAPKVDTSDQLGLEGDKTFEEIVTPENTDVHQLPQFSFSFFDPDDGNFHTLTQPSMPLTVHSAGMASMPVMAANTSSSEKSSLPQDILPIKDEFGAFASSTPPLVARPAFLALQSLPVLAWLAALVWRRRMDNLANNPRLRRRRAVAQLVSGGLSDLNKFAVENKSNEFFAMLFRLLQEQLGERLDCPASAITEADVDRRLILLGASPATLESLRELFQLCNQARYAPIQTHQELAAVAAKFKMTVTELQSLKP